MKIEMNGDAAVAFIMAMLIMLIALIIICIAIDKSREHQQRIEQTK